MRKIVLCALALLCVGIVKADIELPAIIGDHMVLKQKSKVTLWGKEKANTPVSVTASWDNKTYTTMADADGKWRVEVKTPGAGGPYTIVFEGNNRVVVNDVLLGEVWLSSGQSNMEWTMKKDTQSETMLPKATNPNIRLFKVQKQKTREAVDSFREGTSWAVCSPEAALEFSAMTYYFAMDLQEKLHVPVGVINASWGGSPIEAWIPTTSIMGDSLLLKSVHRWNQWQRNHKKESAKYERETTDYKSGKTKVKPKEPSSVYMMKRKHRQPGVLFNGMIAPCTSYALSGFLWYQGTSNVGLAHEYEHQMSTLISDWRKAFHNDKLPVIIGQLTAYKGYAPEKGYMLRMAQLDQNKKPNVYVFSTMDLGTLEDVHPPHKQPYGQRFSSMALNKVYGQKKVACMCPQVKGVKAEKSGLVITFSDGEGLHVKGNALEDIFIAGEDGKYLPAETAIKGNKLIVSHPDIVAPKKARYLFNNTEGANLYNKADFPAFPFVVELK